MDMTGVEKDARATLEQLMRDYCAGTGQTFMIATMEQLKAQGYIGQESSYSGFEDGILYAFNEKSTGPETMSFMAHKWKAPLAGYGATFYMKLANGEWVLDHTEMEWIS